MSRAEAEQGNAGAQLRLGWIYANGGDGVPKDAVEAARWYRKAAEQGFAPAQSELGSLYFDGIGCPRDLVEAYKWTNLAAAQGDRQRSKARDGMESQMTPAQIAEGQRASREWTEQHEASKQKGTR